MFLLLDKPVGRSSFDCIRKLQKLYGKRIYDRNVKIGHAGTLDPMASGLMIIALGKSTKKLGELTGLDKCYTATIDLSQMSDTWDDEAWGWRASREDGTWKSQKRSHHPGKKIDYHTYVPFEDFHQTTQELEDSASTRGYTLGITSKEPTKEEIQSVLTSFLVRDTFLLTPFSAKKIDGKKLYEYARSGTPILKETPMQLLGCELVSYSFPLVKVKFHVGSGTYIRSLGFELGKAVGWGGILVALRRNSIGSFSLSTA